MINQLIDFVWRNKEWLFSGVGIFLIMLMVSIIKKVYKPKKYHIENNFKTLEEVISSPPMIIPPKPEITPLSLTPKKIFEAIDNAPILQQPDIMNYYIGITVRWEGKVCSATKLNDNEVRILFAVFPTHVFFEVNPDNCPEIKLLKKDGTITVEGKIRQSKEYV